LPNLATYDFYLWGSLKDEVHKTNPHALEEPRNNICHEVLAICREEFQRVNSSLFCMYTESNQSGGNIFTICCTTGEFIILSKGYSLC
jgi:hypothetical protein